MALHLLLTRLLMGGDGRSLGSHRSTTIVKIGAEALLLRATLRVHAV